MNENESIARLVRELIEVKKYWDVTSGQRENLHYCTAKLSPDDSRMIFIPMTTDSDVSLNKLEEIQSIFETESIVLAIQDSDSSTVFYEVTKGLSKAVFNKSKTHHPDSYLRNNKKTLVTEAVNSKKARQTD